MWGILQLVVMGRLGGVLEGKYFKVGRDFHCLKRYLLLYFICSAQPSFCCAFSTHLSLHNLPILLGPIPVPAVDGHPCPSVL